MTTACEAHAFAISSSATTYETVSAPLPPHFSGTMMPSRPSSPMRFTVSCGNRASRSISEAMGATCSCANSRAIAWIICCSSVSWNCISVLLRLLQQSLELVRERGDDLEEVGHDPVIGDLEDRRVGILVDGDDHLRRPHAGQMLDGARDAEAEIELWRDRPTGLADLEPVRPPASV